MPEFNALGRPYARAVFELARDGGDFSAWSAGLAFAATAVEDPELQPLLQDPRVDDEALSTLMIDLCGAHLPAVGANLLKLLVANDRLLALPAIARQFDELRAEAEQTVEAEMVVARPVNKTQQAKVIAALEKRLGRKVMLTVREDETLLGGAVIHAGDLVIDGSAKGRLDKLAAELRR